MTPMAKKKVGGGSEKVLRSQSATKGGPKADEKAKGKKPMVEGDEGTQKGGGNEKGKMVSGDSDWILKPHNPREGNTKIGEKAKGKRKLVVEEQNGENPIVSVKRRRSTNKEIAVPNTSSAEVGAYNLRERKAVAKPGQKMTINAGNKKAGNGASAAKSKPLQKQKKDEGQVNLEKRKSPLMKQPSKSNTKKRSAFVSLSSFSQIG